MTQKAQWTAREVNVLRAWKDGKVRGEAFGWTWCYRLTETLEWSRRGAGENVTATTNRIVDRGWLELTFLARGHVAHSISEAGRAVLAENPETAS